MRRMGASVRPRDGGVGNLLRPQGSSRRLARQRWLLGMLAVGVALLPLVISQMRSPQSARSSGPAVPPLLTPSGPSRGLSQRCAGAAGAANPIAAENTCPGTTAWEQVGAQDWQHNIAAFTAPQSINRGGTIQFYVTTTAPSYTVKVYRIGYYGGAGARLMYTSPMALGINQPACSQDAATRMVSCANWTDPLALKLPPTWISGVYIAQFTSSQNAKSYAIFVVRDDASKAPMLVAISTNTYQAYNQWGGYSLYYGPNHSRERAHQVSFDRPYDTYGGMSNFLVSGYSFVRFAEREGFDVSYTTDTDMQAPHALLARHLIVFADHSEYWTTPMRQHITAARDHGVSLAFFAANNVYWHARLASSPLGPNRVLICYRHANLDPITPFDPREATVRWRDAPVSQPEDALLGQMYMGIPDHDTYSPLNLASGAAPFLRGTHLHPGSMVPGLVGGEVDALWHSPEQPRNVIVLASSFAPCHTGYCPLTLTALSQAVLYTAPSGAHVFDAGTFYWTWGLDDARGAPYMGRHSYANSDFQRFTHNLIEYLMDTGTGAPRDLPPHR